MAEFDQAFVGSYSVIRQPDTEIVPMHKHSVWQLMVFLEGTGYVQVEAHHYPFSPGTIICVPPHQMHRQVPDQSYKMFTLGTKRYLIPGEQVSILRNEDPRHLLMLLQLYQEVFEQRPLNYSNILRNVEIVMQNFLISWLEQKPRDELMGLVQNMERNISNPNFKVADAIAAVPLHDNYVRRQFRQIYGITPGSFMNLLRISEAKKHLLTTSMNVKEVAERCGYSDANYFTRAFRQATGYTPQAYRKYYQIWQAAAAEGAEQPVPPKGKNR